MARRNKTILIVTPECLYRGSITLVFLLLFPAFSLADTTTGLIGWWKMDEGTGTSVYDSSGNGLTGSFSGSPSWIKGKFGNALDFGNPNYIVIDALAATAAATGDITMSAWIKFTSTFTGGTIYIACSIGDAPSTNDARLYFNTTGVMYWELYTGAFQRAASTKTTWQGGAMASYCRHI